MLQQYSSTIKQLDMDSNREAYIDRKELARKKYSERQFAKWVNWSIKNRGKVLFKEIIEKQIEYKIVKQ